jgi:group II intron reverse transcriptase/maturase
MIDLSGVVVLKSIKLKFHSLTGRIDMNLMRQAFKNVKKNRGRAGIDNISIAMIEANLGQNLTALMNDLKSGRYWPRPNLRVNILKNKRKKTTRPLGIPTVRDRVAQEVIRRVIQSCFEPFFSTWSFGFIPGRNCHQAVRAIINFRKQGFIHVLDADIKSFFDNIPHELIMKLVADKIADGNILRIIHRFLKAGVVENGQFYKSIKGTPQGGVISPMLANIVLDVLDKKLTDMGYAFVRYADDFLVLTKSAPELEKARDVVKSVIQDELGLQLSKEKTKLTSFQNGFDFLGFHFTPRYVSIRSQSVEKFKDTIRKLTIRSHNFSADCITGINRVTVGYANYFATDFASVRHQFNYLDRFIRRRLRSMKTKRISIINNRKIPNRFFEKRGLLALGSVILYN